MLINAEILFYILMMDFLAYILMLKLTMEIKH